MTHRIVSCLLAALALRAPALAAETSIEHHLPADAILSLCYYGDNPDIEKTALAQLLQEPEVTEWLTSVRTAIGGANQLLAAFLRVNPALLQPLLGCRVGLALLPPAGQGGPPAALVVAKVGAPGSLAREQVNAFLAQAGGAIGLAAQKLQIAGLDATQLGPGPDGLCFGLRDEFLFFSSSRATLERALAANTPKLAAQASFQAAAASSGSPVALLLYDHATVMERFGAEMPPEARALAGALGLNGVRGVGMRLGAKGRALVGSIVVHTTGERRGLIRAWAGAPADRALLKLAPRDAGLAWITSTDPTALYDLVIEVFASVAGQGAVNETIAELTRQAGFSLRDDLFGSLAPGTLITTSGKSLLPPLIVSQRLKDGERFDGAMTKLVAQLHRVLKAEDEEAGAELRTIAFGGHTIRYLATPGIGVPLAPCYARHGGRVIFALTPIHLKDYLAFLDAGEPSILEDPGFQQMAALVPKDATSIAYSDFGEAFVSGYAILGPLLTLVHAIPGNPVPIDLANLPSIRTVRKHMFPAISYSYGTDNLVVSETHSPIGVSAIGPAPALFLLGVGAGFALPAVASARGAARNAVSINNLRQVSMALILYDQDRGALPVNLGALLDAKVIEDPKLLVAPDDPAPPQVGGKPCSYVYFLDGHLGAKLRLGEIDDPARTPVVWERQPFRQGRRAVAFADAHVEAMTEPDFQRALQRVEQALKGKRKAGEL